MYENFAEFYDVLMTANYAEWIDSVSEYLCGKTGVDLACGTGKFTIGLIKRGFDVVGVDISAEMLAKAYENALREKIKANFIRQDMKDFVPFGKQDFCICMCDGINYISNPAPLFARVFSYLKKGGVFIFDLSTAYRIKQILAGNTFSETNDGITYIWRNNLPQGRRLDMELTFFASDGKGKYIKKEETQTMYIHDENTLTEELKKRGFSVTLKGERLSERKKGTSQRIHFICKKIKE